MSEETERSSALERKLELVVKTGLLLTQTHALETETIVQAATDAGLELCGAQFGAFFYNVVNAAGESYLLYTLSGVDREKFDQFPMPRTTAVFAPTFEGTGVVRSGDITKDPRYGKSAPHFDMPRGHLPLRSYLAVPVKAQSGEILGGLFYGHADVDVFEQSSEAMVSAIAAQAAIAIENANLRDELVNKINALEEKQERDRDVSKRLAELAAIVESSDDAILSKDLNGTILSWNDAATRVLGFTADEMVGTSIMKLIPPHLHDDEKTIIGNVRAGRRVEHFETQRLTSKGELLDVSLTVSPIRDDTGEIIGASKILRDISSRKRMETSLLQAEKIAATGRMAATIAHEINNPLEAVMNLLYLLRSSVTGKEGVEYLASAESELMRVSHIAKQTLGFYREHASASMASVSDLADYATKIYEPRCMAANIKMVRSFQASRMIVLRRGEIMQVISNLIANATYAMPEGGTLRVTTTDVVEPSEGVLLTVGDNGVGVHEEHMARVFEAFFTTRTAIGTGIGLFVARQFVEGHGGTITLESHTEGEAHGTVVSVFLPLQTKYEVEPTA